MGWTFTARFKGCEVQAFNKPLSFFICPTIKTLLNLPVFTRCVTSNLWCGLTIYFLPCCNGLCTLLQLPLNVRPSPTSYQTAQQTSSTRVKTSLISRGRAQWAGGEYEQASGSDQNGQLGCLARARAGLKGFRQLDKANTCQVLNPPSEPVITEKRSLPADQLPARTALASGGADLFLSSVDCQALESTLPDPDTFCLAAAPTRSQSSESGQHLVKTRPDQTTARAERGSD
ncbi:hypothetical protein RRG08_022363 [Elysia crispata]|uniref:Uncharacterized protein n=1 Tax=Elysia crispata TaxID=231223 RepID=A0AAE0Z1H4_9GAST|nr:hypothetical protein RRG08_022363 [Elysia crispata]